MSEPNQEDTHPTRVRTGNTQPTRVRRSDNQGSQTPDTTGLRPPESQGKPVETLTSGSSPLKGVAPKHEPPVPPVPEQKKAGKSWFSWLPRRVILAVSLAILLITALTTGAFAGYRSAKHTQAQVAQSQSQKSLQEQYLLGAQDMQAGRYEVARQRFEYILSLDPTYPGAADRLAEVMAVLFATATPTQPAPTITPTPTRDLRPVEQLFEQAKSLFNGEDWSGTIDTLLSLRKADKAYLVTQVDKLLYLSLRNRGIDKILAQANLSGGIYDLALAARFAPLDVDANNAREWARLYLVGVSFWEVHPEQAVYYLSQVASAVPGLRDSDGWTAAERYRVALIQYGDLLASQEKWCDAQAQYQLALNLRPDAEVEEKLRQAALQCSPPTGVPSSGTPTPTPTFPFFLTPSPTEGGTPTPTSTFPIPPLTTQASPTTPAQPPTDTQPAPPTDTQPAPIQTTPPYPAASEKPDVSPAGLLAGFTTVIFFAWRILFSIGRRFE